MSNETLTMPSTPAVDQGSVTTFQYYKELLEKRGVNAVNHTALENGDPTDLEHLLWMCNFCLPNIRDDGRGMDTAKYSRWLGYVQGCLICKGITTVEAERNRTRAWFTS